MRITKVYVKRQVPKSLMRCFLLKHREIQSSSPPHAYQTLDLRLVTSQKRQVWTAGIKIHWGTGYCVRCLVYHESIPLWTTAKLPYCLSTVFGGWVGLNQSSTKPTTSPIEVTTYSVNHNLPLKLATCFFDLFFST